MLIYDREETIKIDGQVKYQMHKYNYKTKLTATVQFAFLNGGFSLYHHLDGQIWSMCSSFGSNAN